MVLELRNVDQLALSLFDKEATYDAGPSAWLAANACSVTGFEGMAQFEDETVDDREGVTGTEMPTSQEILKKGWALEYTENRLRPNTLAGLAALHFGSFTTVQEAGKTAYYHKIQQLEGGTATITAATIAFVDSNPDTITDSGNGFVAAGFKSGMVIVVSGSVANDGVYTIDTVAAGTLTLQIDAALTAGALGPAITITALGLPLTSFITEPLISPVNCVPSFRKKRHSKSLTGPPKTVFFKYCSALSRSSGAMSAKAFFPINSSALS